LNALNDKEWKELQEKVKKKDSEQANLIGVNLFSTELKIKIVKGEVIYL